MPAKIVLLFSCTALLKYVPKVLFTQATIDYLSTNKTKNALHNETVILNYIGDDPISRSLSNYPYICKRTVKVVSPKRAIKFCRVP